MLLSGFSTSNCTVWRNVKIRVESCSNVMGFDPEPFTLVFLVSTLVYDKIKAETLEGNLN